MRLCVKCVKKKLKPFSLQIKSVVAGGIENLRTGVVTIFIRDGVLKLKAFSIAETWTGHDYNERLEQQNFLLCDKRTNDRYHMEYV